MLGGLDLDVFTLAFDKNDLRKEYFYLFLLNIDKNKISRLGVISLFLFYTLSGSYLGHSHQKSLEFERFQQIVRHIQVKAFHSVLMIGGGDNNRRWVGERF